MPDRRQNTRDKVIRPEKSRWFHWVNFPILSAMIFSGLLIYWAYDPYRIGLGAVTLLA